MRIDTGQHQIRPKLYTYITTFSKIRSIIQNIKHSDGQAEYNWLHVECLF